MELGQITFFQALSGGVFTFLAPCILPIVLAYIVYLFSLGTYLEDKHKRLNSFWCIVLHGALFSIGFLFIFGLMQAAPTNVFIYIFSAKRFFLVFGGVVFVLIGLYFTFSPWCASFKIFERAHVSFWYIVSLVLGISFGFSWSACIGPSLGAVLFLLAIDETYLRGLWYLLIFIKGLALPFLLIALALAGLERLLRKQIYAHRYVLTIAGLVVIIFGLLLLSNKLGLVSGHLVQFGSLELYLLEQGGL